MSARSRLQKTRRQDNEVFEDLKKESSMKRSILAISLITLILVVPAMRAQEKEKSADAAKPAAAERPITPLRVQVVFTEFDGDKKIGSLPYSFLVNADDRGAPAAVRMTFHVPVETSNGAGSKHVGQYPLTTNMDGRAEKADDGRFLLRLNVEKDSIYLAGANQKPSSLGGNEADPTRFSNTGQSAYSRWADHPINGRYRSRHWACDKSRRHTQRDQVRRAKRIRKC
jgi:hypothetical protein